VSLQTLSMFYTIICCYFFYLKQESNPRYWDRIPACTHLTTLTSWIDTNITRATFTKIHLKLNILKTSESLLAIDYLPNFFLLFEKKLDTDPWSISWLGTSMGWWIVDAVYTIWICGCLPLPVDNLILVSSPDSMRLPWRRDLGPLIKNYRSKVRVQYPAMLEIFPPQIEKKQ